MQPFDMRFRERFDRKEVLDKFEDAYDRLIALKRPGIHVPTLVPELATAGRLPKTPIKLMSLMQIAIRRAIELADAVVRDTNASSYTPPYTNARSLFELASLIYDAHKRLDAIKDKWDMQRYLEFHEHLNHVLLGWKSEEWHPGRDNEYGMELRAKNVLTIIQRIDKEIPGYFKLYELLSEVAHPNYMGMMEAYQALARDALNFEFIDSPTSQDANRIGIALDCAEGALGMLADTVAEFERDFVPLATLVAEMVLDSTESDEALRNWKGRV